MTDSSSTQTATGDGVSSDAILDSVLEEIRRVARDDEVELSPGFDGPNPPLDLPLLESGLDSIGFATVVALLEERLGFDPFLLSDEPVYPTTLGEFVAVYRDAQPA